MPSQKRINEIAAELLDKNHVSEWAGARLFDHVAEVSIAGDLSWIGSLEEAKAWVGSVLDRAEIKEGRPEPGSGLARRIVEALSTAMGDEWDGAECADAMAEALRSGAMECSAKGLKFLQSKIEKPLGAKRRAKP